MPLLPSVGRFVLAGGASSRMGRDKALLELGDVPMIVRGCRLLAGLAAHAAPAGGGLVTVSTRPVTIVGHPDLYGHLGWGAVADEHPGCGPLGGIATALRHSDSEWNLIIGCDMPYLTRDWLEHLIGLALTARGPTRRVLRAPGLTGGRIGRAGTATGPMARAAVGSDADVLLPEGEYGGEPLCAMYRTRGEAAISAALARGVRKITEGLAGLAVEAVPRQEWKRFDSGGRLFKNINTPADYAEACAHFAGSGGVHGEA